MKSSSCRRALAATAGALCLMAHAASTPSTLNWSLFETARDNGRRLATVADAAPAIAADAPVLRVEPATTFQEIVGFGGALTESSAWVLAQLPAEKRAEVLRRYFDPKDGIGYTLARTHINSCDFSLNTWSLDDTPGDTALKDFTLAPMRKWLLPLLHDAQKVAGGKRLRLLASPWSPPAWMKTNGEMCHGGSLRPEHRDAWARFFVKFAEEMKHEGLPLWGLTVQNEPQANQVWESCLYTGAEEGAFVRDHLGPTLAQAGLGGLKLMVLDHNRDILEAHVGAILGDPAAARYVWGSAIHWYVSEDFAASSRLHAKFPDKGILFTEGCWEGGAKPGQWDRGERYARNIIGDLRNWVRGWIDWNIALDLQGGPNHVGNFCDAPVLVDTAKGTVLYQTSFDYIAHFSRHILPGARRIESSGGPAGVQSVAFVNPDGSFVVVALNATDAAAEFTLNLAGETRACRVPAHGIQTYTARRG